MIQLQRSTQFLRPSRFLGRNRVPPQVLGTTVATARRRATFPLMPAASTATPSVQGSDCKEFGLLSDRESSHACAAGPGCAS